LASTKRKIAALAQQEIVNTLVDPLTDHPHHRIPDQLEVTVRIMDEEDQLAHMIDVERERERESTIGMVDCDVDYC